MSDLSPADLRALTDKLARLGPLETTIEGRWINLGSDQGPKLLSRILQEIDDTVLPATLTFQRNDSLIAVDVAGRRLVGVRLIEGLSNKAAELTDKKVSPEDTAIMSGLSKEFRQFAELEGAVTVKSEGLRDAPEGASVGASYLQMELAFGLTVELPEGDSPLEKLRNGLGDAVLAYVAIENDAVVGTSGDDTLVSSLEDIVATRLKGFQDDQGAKGYLHADPSYMVLDDAGPDGQSLILARLDSESLLAFASNEACKTVLPLWRALSS